MNFNDIDELTAAIGTEVGVSDWVTIDQERINRFADATDDHQWIHIDTKRSAGGPYGHTIAHGFLTLSLLAPTSQEVMQVNASTVVNYGLDRVRFITPVPAGGRVRGRVAITKATEIPGGVQVTRTITVELDGEPVPACVAESLVRYLW